MNNDIEAYHSNVNSGERPICEFLQGIINKNLRAADSKMWHGAPVWFLDGNPVVGYSVFKNGVRLLFWSGMGFDGPELQPGTGKFKDASITYTAIDQIDIANIECWLRKAEAIQWDYKNIVKRKGVLKRLK